MRSDFFTFAVPIPQFTHCSSFQIARLSEFFSSSFVLTDQWFFIAPLYHTFRHFPILPTVVCGCKIEDVPMLHRDAQFPTRRLKNWALVKKPVSAIFRLRTVIAGKIGRCRLKSRRPKCTSCCAADYCGVRNFTATRKLVGKIGRCWCSHQRPKL